MSTVAAREVGFVAWGGDSTATLHADGSWLVEHGGVAAPVLARMLGSHYEGWDRSPSLYYGQRILPDLARILGGEHVFHQPEPAPPGVDF